MMWENNDINHMKFYSISYGLRWKGALCEAGIFFFADFCTIGLSAPEKNAASNPWSK